jgi:hypothetical protein
MIERHRLHLNCAGFWVDVRLMHTDGKWLASADTPDGPSIGIGRVPEDALARALRPFEGVIDELLETVPDQFHWRSRAST